METLLIVVGAVLALAAFTLLLAKWTPQVVQGTLPRVEVRGAPPEPVEPTCGNCKHWDLEEGQAVIRAHPHFMQAARYVAPAEMGRVARPGPTVPCRDCGGQGKLGTMRYRDGVEITTDCSVCGGKGTIETQVLSEPSAPYKARWDQFGACLNSKAAPDGDSSCTWSGDSCKHFEAVELVPLRRNA